MMQKAPPIHPSAMPLPLHSAGAFSQTPDGCNGPQKKHSWTKFPQTIYDFKLVWSQPVSNAVLRPKGHTKLEKSPTRLTPSFRPFTELCSLGPRECREWQKRGRRSPLPRHKPPQTRKALTSWRPGWVHHPGGIPTRHGEGTWGWRWPCKQESIQARALWPGKQDGGLEQGVPGMRAGMRA